MIRPLHVALVALALLSGSAGFVAHRALSGPVAPAPVTLEPASAARSPDTPPGDGTLDWAFSDLGGESVSLERWRGRLLVVNFWATWCPPCLREIPAFVDLQARYGDRGVQFVGIALDHPEVVAPFVAEKGMNYPVLVGNDDVVRYMQALGNAIGGLPYTAVISPAGEVLETHQGEWESAAAEAVLAALLADP